MNHYPELPISPTDTVQGATSKRHLPKAELPGRRKHEFWVGTAGDREADGWLTPSASSIDLKHIGFKAFGGGVHQARTMMLADLAAVVTVDAAAIRPAVLDENVLGKPSARARTVALRRLGELYGSEDQKPIWVVLQRLWNRDSDGRPVLALLCALARDPTLRAGAPAVLDASLGERVAPDALAAAFEMAHPRRLGVGMAASLSRNASSSWLQAGFLAGPIRKLRVRAKATPYAAAFAALLAGLCGFGGMRLLASRWLDVLDCPTEERLSLLRQAEGLGLARVRSAGDVLEIETLRPIAETLGIPVLVER